MSGTRLISAALMMAALAAPLSAQDAQVAAPNPQIDYSGFAELVAEVSPYREARLLSREDFVAQARAKDALILDTRSAAAFAAGHIKGAVNLPFSDFTSTSLRKVVGDNPDRPILIYCNNNFSDNAPPIRAKKAELALNIPTFINLYGYGYTNLWELEGVMMTSEVDWISASASPD